MLARYEARGIPLPRTDRDGAVRFDVAPADGGFASSVIATFGDGTGWIGERGESRRINKDGPDPRSMPKRGPAEREAWGESKR